jgi:hypothetical protein
LFHSRGYLDPYGLTAQPEWTSPPREPQRRPTGQAEFVICDYTIEAGIKEGKQVFQMHHLKVRSAPALVLQEQFAVFAANFVRWAAAWLTMCPHQSMNERCAEPKGIKNLVQVGAHTSARVVRLPDGCSLRFTKHSVFAGRTMGAHQWAIQLPLPTFKSPSF